MLLAYQKLKINIKLDYGLKWTDINKNRLFKSKLEVVL